MVMRAIRVHTLGGPENLRLDRDVPIPQAKKGEVRIKNKVGGVNYIDTYFRTGLYPKELPFIPGGDGAGTIDQVGEGVTDFKVGDRVAYWTGSGSYAEYTTAPMTGVAKLPDSVPFEVGSAAMVQGLTAHYLVKGSYNVKKGDTVFVHAAAGGLGQLLCQAASHLGARVIGTTSSEEKAKKAKEAGCDEVILYTKEDFVDAAKKLTDGKGFNVVYDSIGKDTSLKSLSLLRRRGMLVLFGNASGKPDPVDPMLLAKGGSLSMTRPSLIDFVSDPQEFKERATEVFEWIQQGILKPELAHEYQLEDAPQAHRDLEAKKTTGKVNLVL
eukprot:TRINITY_DN17167_c0_g1_i1.p1 TRINITY_DN17167_c0_g1~~TRINITY_DN17167_c0_g1_i1.p1  ORF type:complete len:326 (+),score=110.16 TRINITY_DN17167_c0_g1_i1:15-992(+)